MIGDIGLRAFSVFRPAGSCRMGAWPASGVVDPSLKVHGGVNRRVIDAAAVPAVTSPIANAPMPTIAGDGADLVPADSGAC